MDSSKLKDKVEEKQQAGRAYQKSTGARKALRGETNNDSVVVGVATLAQGFPKLCVV